LSKTKKDKRKNKEQVLEAIETNAVNLKQRQTKNSNFIPSFKK